MPKNQADLGLNRVWFLGQFALMSIKILLTWLPLLTWIFSLKRLIWSYHYLLYSYYKIEYQILSLATLYRIHTLTETWWLSMWKFNWPRAYGYSRQTFPVLGTNKTIKLIILATWILFQNHFANLTGMNASIWLSNDMITVDWHEQGQLLRQIFDIFLWKHFGCLTSIICRKKSLIGTASVGFTFFLFHSVRFKFSLADRLFANILENCGQKEMRPKTIEWSWSSVARTRKEKRKGRSNNFLPFWEKTLMLGNKRLAWFLRFQNTYIEST